MTAPSLPPLADLLVSGTDTGVGKTYVTAALAAACAASGRRVAVLKAAQTGDDDDAAWIAARVPGIVVRTALRYAAPLAPVVAARLEGAPEPRLEPIVAAARELRAGADGLLVEGSGGLLVPINTRQTFADLALALALPLLIVARPGLGTLNHTALTVEVARARGVEVAGVIVCGTSADPEVAERTNLAELQRLAPVLASASARPRRLARARYGLRVIDLRAIEEHVLVRGEPLAREDALGIAALHPGARPGAVLARAPRAPRALWAEVSVESIVSAKTGGCSEDCSFCSQSARFPTPVRAAWLDVDGMVEAARGSQAAGATEFCIVVAVRGPDERLLCRTIEATAAIKRETHMQVACSLGLLDDEQAQRLAEGGMDRYNHNLEAARSFFPAICTSHSFDERYETCLRARAPAWSSARAASSAWASPGSSASSSPTTSPRSIRTRCR